jgi:hypothetical protein
MSTTNVTSPMMLDDEGEAMSGLTASDQADVLMYADALGLGHWHKAHRIGE